MLLREVFSLHLAFVEPSLKGVVGVVDALQIQNTTNCTINQTPRLEAVFRREICCTNMRLGLEVGFKSEKKKRKLDVDYNASSADMKF